MRERINAQNTFVHKGSKVQLRTAIDKNLYMDGARPEDYELMELHNEIGEEVGVVLTYNVEKQGWNVIFPNKNAYTSGGVDFDSGTVYCLKKDYLVSFHLSKE